MQIDEVRKDIGLEASEAKSSSRLPEDDVTNFCLWLKDTMASKVSIVNISKRLTNIPLVLFG